MLGQRLRPVNVGVLGNRNQSFAAQSRCPPARPAEDRLKSVLLSEAAEETVGLPGGTRVGAGYSERKLFEDPIELRGGGFVQRLRRVIGGAVVTIFVPVVEKFFFGSAGEPA